jgi:hypothetical protein
MTPEVQCGQGTTRRASREPTIVCRVNWLRHAPPACFRNRTHICRRCRSCERGYELTAPRALCTVGGWYADHGTVPAIRDSLPVVAGEYGSQVLSQGVESPSEEPEGWQDRAIEPALAAADIAHAAAPKDGDLVFQSPHRPTH